MEANPDQAARLLYDLLKAGDFPARAIVMPEEVYAAFEEVSAADSPFLVEEVKHELLNGRKGWVLGGVLLLCERFPRIIEQGEVNEGFLRRIEALEGVSRL